MDELLGHRASPCLDCLGEYIYNRTYIESRLSSVNPMGQFVEMSSTSDNLSLRQLRIRVDAGRNPPGGRFPTARFPIPNNHVDSTRNRWGRTGLKSPPCQPKVGCGWGILHVRARLRLCRGPGPGPSGMNLSVMLRTVCVLNRELADLYSDDVTHVATSTHLEVSLPEVVARTLSCRGIAPACTSCRA